MPAKKPALSRGLNALLSSIEPTESVAVVNNSDNINELEKQTPTSSLNTNMLHYLPINKLKPSAFQPRHFFDQAALEELAASIKTQGMIQPVVVRAINKTADTDYEIIAGERRWRAAQLAGLTTIPAVIREFDDQTVMVVALIENIQREALNPIEEARALQRLLNCNLTHEQIAKAISKSRTAVTNLLRLLNLEESVRARLEKGEIEMGHARTLLSLSPHQQAECASIICEKNLSVRQTESWVRSIQQADTGPKRSINSVKNKIDVNIRALETKLSEKLATPIEIKHLVSGRGKLIVHYHSLDELQEIINLLVGELAE